ncbi:MAG: peptide-methionine (S)-S-oxide reductase MsrA [Candidatus Melainabacteria bacterium]|nr:peptide-methionine (S)-S-oxide reductase MsrA [Candidatus Melainabacteria bacterium]
MQDTLKKATFGAGCFWHIEEEFKKLTGVMSTSVGFMGGDFKNPSYKDVCTGATGHAEVVHFEYDTKIISYEKLLEVFWNIHDPTTLNKQGPDIGTQYRSIIFFHNEEQEKTANASKIKLEKSGKFKNKIVTEIKPAQDFYKAEEYHQQYFEKQKKCGI